MNKYQYLAVNRAVIISNILPSMEMTEKLALREFQDYNENHVIKRHALPPRIAAYSYLRHNFTNYDAIVIKLNGNHLAHKIWKDRVNCALREKLASSRHGSYEIKLVDNQADHSSPEKYY